MNTLTKQTKINIKNASRALGLAEGDVLECASRYYLDAIRGEVELQMDFDLWERMSDETLAKSGV